VFGQPVTLAPPLFSGEPETEPFLDRLFQVRRTLLHRDDQRRVQPERNQFARIAAGHKKTVNSLGRFC